MRKRAKVDATHGPIVEAFRAGGWKVLSLAALGDGAPDLLVRSRRRGWLYLIEVKTGKGKLNEDQQRFASQWDIFVLHSVDEAIAFMKGR